MTCDLRHGSFVRSLDDGEVSGDAVLFVRPRAGRLRALLVDGAGHGASAAEAERCALEWPGTVSAEHPEEVISGLHEVLRGTVGASVAVLDVEQRSPAVRLASVGNSRLLLVSDDERRWFDSQDGLLGHQLPTVRGLVATLGRGLLVLASDDVSRSKLGELAPWAFLAEPAEVARRVVTECGRWCDDASCLVVEVTR
jgi:hypothetical protein